MHDVKKNRMKSVTTYFFYEIINFKSFAYMKKKKKGSQLTMFINWVPNLRQLK